MQDCRVNPAFKNYKFFFRQQIGLQLRKGLMKCNIWSKALCGAETLALRKADQEHLENVEMWCWRWMEKISWAGLGNNYYRRSKKREISQKQ